MKACRALFLGLALAVTGCSQRLEAITVEPLTTSPLDMTVTRQTIATFEGVGIAIRLRAYTQDPEQSNDPSNPPPPEDSADVHVVSENEAVLTVHRVKGSTYILTGTGAGHTRLRVTDDGADGEILVDVLVSAQTP